VPRTKSKIAGGREITIDGKTIRGSGGKCGMADHIVSAWVGEQNLVLGRLKTEEKGNVLDLLV
jgi:hypothetical protein